MDVILVLEKLLNIWLCKSASVFFLLCWILNLHILVLQKVPENFFENPDVRICL